MGMKKKVGIRLRERTGNEMIIAISLLIGILSRMGIAMESKKMKIAIGFRTGMRIRIRIGIQIAIAIRIRIGKE